MCDCDLDLVAVCTFISELSLDEIIQYDPAAVTFSCEEGFAFDEMAGESSVTGATSDEASDSEDSRSARQVLKGAVKKPKKPKTELQRKLQQVYDKKSRTNKRARHHALSESFVPVLEEFVNLMQFRIARTENEINLLCLAKKTGSHVPSTTTAHRQLELNHGALECIKMTEEDWRRRKSGESGRCFLRQLSSEIQHLLNSLLALGDHLRAATDELRWRLKEETVGVWV